jgi:hypothetical protein
LDVETEFGAQVGSVDEFLDRAKPSVLIEITALNPETGEPAISYIRSTIAGNIHVITGNKVPSHTHIPNYVGKLTGRKSNFGLNRRSWMAGRGREDGDDGKQCGQDSGDGPWHFEPLALPYRSDGHLGTLSIEPGVEQTAYGLFSDLVDIARFV